jgi:Tol biopolymer transport system component
MILGTAAYMSPEQARGKPVDKRADIWAFGVVLFEMLTGEQLFQGETVSDTLAAVLRAGIDCGKLPVQTPEPIRQLLRRCLVHDVRKRMRDIGEARIILEDPERATEIPKQSPQRSLQWVWPGVALLFAALFLAVSVAYFRQQPPAQSPLRFAIVPPENSRVHSFAISPDGRRLAVAAAVNGKRQLWMRGMDAVQFQPMPGTEDAVFPFWSPDSRYIGFFAQLKLKKVPADGGPVQSLCSAGPGGGGTWNTEDVILFSTGYVEGSLQRIQAAGGVPSDVLKTNAAYPVFLPGGHRFLYSLVFAPPEKTGIYLGSLVGGASRRILPDPSNVLLARASPGSRTGHLLFSRENTLMAQPFDAVGGQSLGEVFPVGEVANALTAALMLATVSETGILLYADRGSFAGNQMLWYDRTGRVLGPVAAPGVVYTPAISRDERFIAYSRRGSSGADIWLRDLSRGIETRFTADPSGNYDPVWSPTGDQIAWASSRRGGLNLYRKTRSGSSPDEPMLPVAPLALPVTPSRSSDQWSRDGRFIVYSEAGSNGKKDLWVLPIGSGDRKPVPFLKTEFEELHGQLSPDSAWMAYASDETGPREVYVRPFPSGEGVSRISTAGGDQPRWRGDGKELFYAGADGRMMAVPVRAVTAPKPSFEPGTPVPLFESHILATPTTNGVFQYDVTADGKRFLVVTADAATPPFTVVVNWNAGR